jgi:hypothetical protein
VRATLALPCGAGVHARSPRTRGGAQIDPGSLTFCTGVSYVSCMRVPVPSVYDKLVSDVRVCCGSAGGAPVPGAR